MRRSTSTDRPGFTMIELLVVITVITLMMALLIGASFRFVVGARESATSATIMKANGIIQDRVRSFRETDFSDAAISGRDSWNFNYPSAKIDSPLAEVLIRKARFKKAFPQAFAELDQSQINRFFPTNYPPSGLYQPRFESGIVLFAVLSKGETFGAATPGEDTFTGAEVKISPETGSLPCLVDAWGEPLRFYRWPTRLIRCGELDIDGDGTFDDYNQNGTQEAAGVIDSSGQLAFCPAIRPFAASVSLSLSGLLGPTPASLLISNLPPFDRNNRGYAKGPDGHPGAPPVPSGFDGDDDKINGVDDVGEIGWPDTDDPEPLNTDPDDPVFRLSAVLGTLALRKQFVAEKHDFYTFHTPLIVSSGPDKRLGLFEPSDLPNFGYLAAPLTAAPGSTFANSTMRDLFDDITNLNRRTGGK